MCGAAAKPGGLILVLFHDLFKSSIAAAATKLVSLSCADKKVIQQHDQEKTEGVLKD